MYIKTEDKYIFMNFSIISISVLLLSMLTLLVITFQGLYTPIFLFLMMLFLGYVFIIVFSKHDLLLKLKLFIFFFSVYVFYIMLHDYILINISPEYRPLDFTDENTFYHFTLVGLPYISGKKDFLEIFSVFEINESILHTLVTSSIAYLSVLIDGTSTLVSQKFLSPFLGSLLSVVLFSTIQYQFNNQKFAFNATLGYGLLSAVFMYSTPLLRDIDIALLYMISFSLFLQKNSFLNLILLLIVAYLTLYLRLESGMVLFGVTILYCYFYVKELHSKDIKLIFYIFLIVLFFVVLLLISGRIIRMIEHLNHANTLRSMTVASSGSIGILLNKLPFPFSYISKVLFGQIQPFPFYKAIDRPMEAISALFWPFIFLMMSYAIIKKNIRKHIDTKIFYLLFVSVAILVLMSSEPMTRRMMSVYPPIYLTSLYVFWYMSKSKIKNVFYYYILGILFMNSIYFILKFKG